VNRWLVDTNVIIDASRAGGHVLAAAADFLATAARTGELWSVTPVRTEVAWLLRPEESAVVHALFDRIFWLDVTVDIADRAAAFGQRYGPSHGIGVVDAIIAAAAETLSATVATRNVRHFPMFPGLARPY
jgi:predicted nucleic acid-binding protein